MMHTAASRDVHDAHGGVEAFFPSQDDLQFLFRLPLVNPVQMSPVATCLHGEARTEDLYAKSTAHVLAVAW